jgi:hypothetical protein
MPGDRINGLATRIRQCNELNKPLFIGEAGIRPSDVGGLQSRANLYAAKLSEQLERGIVGYLVWHWRDAAHGGSDTDGFSIGPKDPTLTVLARY